ncbi:protein phosphatase 1 regulatory subunit 7-like [Zingiber officinale]|uniref:protein phosphatase 1 regulatory subunit 7-like n=1 Tax=Zingiber officinale TaxID=94328 RepID=UPI001C4C5DD7|nr:protein phosphatase 1 regulatory subunit 7-like [Zingiber officinale]
MVYLTLEQACRETKNDAAATTILKLSYRVLTDVSCLSKFRNLEKLDLSGNCLSSLKDLSSCVNLKWLSVVENKLETLEGIEGLSKLTVLNAGKNMLQSMGGIESITSLHALILNDNKISSICKLDQLSFLNTLVLSRNPIHDIGHSLMKAISITKLSFSHCQIESIGSSLASCVDLKEARFSHNMIMTLPAELARNSSLQNLDVGNNLIENWSDIKVLSALHNLKNLNLQGNPIAEKDKLTKKLKELAPNLKIFNAKPLERIDKSKTAARTERSNPSKDDLPSHATDHAAAKVTKKKMKLDNTSINANNSGKGDAAVRTSKDVEVEKVIELKKLRLKPKIKTQVVMDNDPMKDSSKILQLQGKKLKGDEHLNEEQKDPEGADGAEARFVNLAARHSEENRKVRELEAGGEVVAVILDHAKRRKRSRGTSGALALQLLSSPSEVGMGGPSAWDD